MAQVIKIGLIVASIAAIVALVLSLTGVINNNFTDIASLVSSALASVSGYLLTGRKLLNSIINPLLVNYGLLFMFVLPTSVSGFLWIRAIWDRFTR